MVERKVQNHYGEHEAVEVDHTNTCWFPSVPPPLSPVRFTMLVLPHCSPISGFYMYHHNTKLIFNMTPTIYVELKNC